MKRIHPTGSLHRQRGAALVIALLMLLVMTVLGLASMQITRLEERMAGNARDINVAFQGSEAGLRHAESFIILFRDRPAGRCAGPPCAAGIYATNALPLDLRNQPDAWWRDSPNTTREYGVAGATDIADTVYEPRSVTEELSFQPDSLSRGNAPRRPGKGYFKVTSWSPGANPSTTSGNLTTSVVTETTVAQKYN